MNLTFSDKQAIEALSPIYRPLVEARLSMPFNKLNPYKQKEICLNMVTFLHSKTGIINEDSSILQFQANEFLNELKGINGTLTENEIFMACEGLYRGEYGQFFGLNAKAYNQLLTGFRTNQERGKAWLNYMEEIEKPRIKEKPDISIDVTKQGLMNRFKRFKEKGDIGFVPSKAYDSIKEILGVKSLVSIETFKTVRAELEPRWIDTIKIEKLKAERSGSFTQAEQFSELLANGIENYEPFQRAMKERLLKEYFKSIDELGI